MDEVKCISLYLILMHTSNIDKIHTAAQVPKPAECDNQASLFNTIQIFIMFPYICPHSPTIIGLSSN